jgi:hypothetical protein
MAVPRGGVNGTWSGFRSQRHQVWTVAAVGLTATRPEVAFSGSNSAVLAIGGPALSLPRRRGSRRLRDCDPIKTRSHRQQHRLTPRGR